jgi:hypothetical protein
MAALWIIATVRLRAGLLPLLAAETPMTIIIIPSDSEIRGVDHLGGFGYFLRIVSLAPEPSERSLADSPGNSRESP